MKVSPIESGIRQEMPTLTILTQFSVENLRKIWQDKKQKKLKSSKSERSKVVIICQWYDPTNRKYKNNQLKNCCSLSTISVKCQDME